MSSDVEAAKSMTETEPQLRDPVLDIAESHHNAIILRNQNMTGQMAGKQIQLGHRKDHVYCFKPLSVE